MSERFEVIATPIDGLTLLQRKLLGDARGYLERVFCVQDLCELLEGRQIAQINHTFTARAGTVRGMHFQLPPHGEIKFVTCLRGAVYDVAVDLRRGSPTFLRWHAEVLRSDQHRTLVIPEGFAHGFQTLTEDCEMLYLHTHSYVPHAEAALNATDPRLAIAWPLPIVERSQRDGCHPLLDETFAGVTP